MVERHRRDADGGRFRDHIGRVEVAAEPDFQDQRVGGMAREGEKRRRRGDLEKGDRRAGIGALAFFQSRGEFFFGDQRAGKADALVEAHQMRRGIDMHAIARALQHRAQIGADRTFAVGARDMDDRRQFFLRMAERRQQALDAIQHQIDALGMKRQQPLENGVAGRGLALMPMAYWRWRLAVRRDGR